MSRAYRALTDEHARGHRSPLPSRCRSAWATGQRVGREPAAASTIRNRCRTRKSEHAPRRGSADVYLYVRLLACTPRILVRLAAAQQIEPGQAVGARALERIREQEYARTQARARGIESADVVKLAVGRAESVMTRDDGVVQLQRAQHQAASEQPLGDAAMERAHPRVREHARLAARAPALAVQLEQTVQDPVQRGRCRIFDRPLTLT